MSYDVFLKLCEQHNVKPFNVSKATGISTATFSSWKKGKYTPKTAKLQLIADYFDVPLEYLVTGEYPSDDSFSDAETAAIAREIAENDDLRLLFREARTANSDDIKTAHGILLALKKKERGVYE